MFACLFKCVRQPRANMPSVLAILPTMLPEHLSQAVWRGDAVGQVSHVVIPSGHAALDAELPGGGWPCQSMTEILQAQTGQAEWRLLSPALAQIIQQGGSVLLIGPPHPPHLPGLCREGLQAERLVRIDAHTPAERLWATEQALKARCVSAILSWLPQARAEQIRRLHACAAQHPGPLFVMRPARVQADSSAAPLRLLLRLGPCPHPLLVDVIKRRGPVLAQTLSLPHWPKGLSALLPAPRPQYKATPATPPAPTLKPPPHPADRSPDHVALDRLVAWRAVPS
jgi:protein ImuA